MPEIIAMNPDMRIGATTYHPADMVDVDAVVKQGLLTEPLVAVLKRQNQLAELTPETFEIAACRRPGDAPWPPRGFTAAYLAERGLWTPTKAEKAPKPMVEAKGRKPTVKRAPIDSIALGKDAIVVGNYRIQPKKNGKFSLFDVTDHEGKLLRAKSFRKEADARTFLEALPNATAGDAPPPE